MSATTTPLHKQLHTEAQFESAMKALTATKGNRAEADKILYREYDLTNDAARKSALNEAVKGQFVDPLPDVPQTLKQLPVGSLGT